jgi:HAE1 family hydrophobic/amphiphilic exporter-1
MLMYVNLLVDARYRSKFLYNYADINVLSELKRVNGVGSGDILGTREYAMRIWLKPDRMLAYKISTDEVMEALSSKFRSLTGKTGEASGKRRKHLNMYLNIQVGLQPKAICKYILRSNPDGEILRLKMEY